MISSIGARLVYTMLAGAMGLLVTACNKPVDAVSVPVPSTSVGTEIDDSVITMRVKSALIADPDVKGFDFKVETRKGEVQLSGFVDNVMQAERAMAVARSVSGVKAIDNKVTLKGVAPTIGNAVDDSVITASIKSALLSDANVKSLDIAVVTRKGEAQLSGYVDNQVQIDRAVDIARGIGGVSAVRNEMSIKK